MNNFYLSPEGGRYYLGTQFTYEGRIYFGNAETFSSLGFTLVEVQPMPNPVFYTVLGVNDDGTWDYTEKPLAEVQTQLITDSSNFANSTLQPTDWYVIREVENSTPVPTQYTNWRQSVRDSSDFYTSLVSAAPDITTLENDIGVTPTFPPQPTDTPQGSYIYVEGTSGSDLLTVLGIEDPENPGSYIPFTQAQFGQIGVGMFLNKYGSIVDGLQVVEVLPPAGQIRISAPLSENLSAIAPIFAWSDYDDPVITGVLNTGRGSGVGPNDLNPSWYLSFDSSDPNITEADTYLYQPSTDTVLPYLPSQVPPGFDSFGNCFNGSDYSIQIKLGQAVIATVTVPLGSNTGISF